MSRRAMCRPVTAETAEEIRRACQLAPDAAFALGLAKCDVPLFMLADPTVPLQKLPKLGSWKMSRFLEQLDDEADKAREAGNETLAGQLTAAMDKIDAVSAKRWREIEKPRRERSKAPRQPENRKRGVYDDTLYGGTPTFTVWDSYGEHIMTLAVSAARGFNKHERRDIINGLYRILNALNPKCCGEEDDNDPADHWKR